MIPSANSTANYHTGDVAWHSTAAESWPDNPANEAAAAAAAVINNHCSCRYNNLNHNHNHNHNTNTNPNPSSNYQQQLQLFSNSVISRSQQIQQLDWENAMLLAHHSQNSAAGSNSMYDQVSDFKAGAGAVQANPALHTEAMARTSISKDYDGLLSVNINSNSTVPSHNAAWGSILGSRISCSSAYAGLPHEQAGAAADSALMQAYNHSYGGIGAATAAAAMAAAGYSTGNNNFGLYGDPTAMLRSTLGLTSPDQKRLEDILVKRELYSSCSNHSNNNAVAAALTNHDLNSRLGLNLGGRTYFSADDFVFGRFGKRLRCGPDSAASTMMMMQAAPSCQAEGCKADLSLAKHYHRRHKVCEYHSKAATVHIANQTQRFCQQCSRFHVLSEFDDGKRSCRKRLADHNRRRRKPQPAAAVVNSQATNNNNNNSDGDACKPCSPQETTGSENGGAQSSSKGSPPAAPPAATSTDQAAAAAAQSTSSSSSKQQQEGYVAENRLLLLQVSNSCEEEDDHLSNHGGHLYSSNTIKDHHQPCTITSSGRNNNININNNISASCLSLGAALAVVDHIKSPAAPASTLQADQCSTAPTPNTSNHGSATAAPAAALPWLQACIAGTASSSSSSSNGNNNQQQQADHMQVAGVSYSMNRSCSPRVEQAAHLDGVLGLVGAAASTTVQQQQQQDHFDSAMSSCCSSINGPRHAAASNNSSPAIHQFSNLHHHHHNHHQTINRPDQSAAAHEQLCMTTSSAARASIFGSDISHLI